VGYARLVVQLFASWMQWPCVWNLDDNVLSFHRLDVGSLLAHGDHREGCGPKQVTMAEMLSTMEEHFRNEERCGAADRYAVLGTKRQSASYATVFKPFAACPVFSTFLINVRATVAKGLLFPPKAFWEDIEFCQMCYEEGLVALRYNTFFHNKRNFQIQLTKDLNKSKENPENWSKKPKEAKAPAAGVAHTKTLVPRDADASTLSVPKPQRTDSSSSGPNVSESASSKAHSASVAAPPDTRTEHRSDAAPPKQQPSNGRPASASEASVKTKKRERENDEDKVLFLKKGEDMEEYAVLDALEQLLRKKRRRDVEDRVLELQDRLKDLQKRKARRRHEMLDLSVLGVPALRVKGPDLKGSDSDSDGEPAPEDGAELVQSKKKFQRLRHTTEDDSGDDDDLMQDL